MLYQLTPVMGVTLLLLSLCYERLWHTLPGSPYFAGPWMTLLRCAAAASSFWGRSVQAGRPARTPALQHLGCRKMPTLVSPPFNCPISHPVSILPSSRPTLPPPCSIAIIFGGAVIAFAMVLAEFALIANTSALTFMVAGTFKEIVTGALRAL